jgi:hypothetical protein
MKTTSRSRRAHGLTSGKQKNRTTAAGWPVNNNLAVEVVRGDSRTGAYKEGDGSWCWPTGGSRRGRLDMVGVP